MSPWHVFAQVGVTVRLARVYSGALQLALAKRSFGGRCFEERRDPQAGRAEIGCVAGPGRLVVVQPGDSAAASVWAGLTASRLSSAPSASATASHSGRAAARSRKPVAARRCARRQGGACRDPSHKVAAASIKPWWRTML